eukprot:CAMPEP_0170540018 /NCGR_PEP_ID=MMETSP0211-20121228/5_1 /TAXON_ID=311385 /ORGANISM="Pseudokeronopsis sp., Strain OXSARD2" /LENGTH=178 /DNA_ID=CAMNT_0010842261 /DNA_START=36 /DNA_END=572 /DNA_ORIENTATION=+
MGLSSEELEDQHNEERGEVGDSSAGDRGSIVLAGFHGGDELAGSGGSVAVFVASASGSHLAAVGISVGGGAFSGGVGGAVIGNGGANGIGSIHAHNAGAGVGGGSGAVSSGEASSVGAEPIGGSDAVVSSPSGGSAGAICAAREHSAALTGRATRFTGASYSSGSGLSNGGGKEASQQ